MKNVVLASLALLSAVCANAQVDIDKSINLTGTNPADAKITGIKSVTAARDAVSAEALQSGKLVFATAVSGANDISLTYSPAYTATSLVAGSMVSFKATAANTGNVRLNVDGLGLIPLFKDVSANLAAGNIQAGQIVTALYDGSNFHLVSRIADANSGGTVTSIATTSPITGGTITSSGTIGLTQTGDVLAGTGISVSGGADKLPGTADLTITNTGVTSVSGTANQVNVSGSTGSVTLSTPQNIHTAATPTFAGMNLTGLNASSGVYTDGSKNLTTTPPSSGQLGYFTRSGSYLYPTTLSDNVGIGIATPGQKLEVAGNIKIGDNLSIEGASDFRVYRNLASYSINSSSAPGAFVINTTHPWNANVMFSMKVEGYFYDATSPFEMNIGGYMYVNNDFYNTGYTNIGSHKLTVQFARNTATNTIAIIIGNPAASYSYPKITVTSYKQMYNNINEAYADGWSITQATSLSGFSNIVSVPDVTSAPPSAGSGNYIQNGTSAQSANFNITGTGTIGSALLMGGPIRRSDHAVGFLEGSYNNVGANSTFSNPIYTIGSAYNPSNSSLGNMYGIGYSHGNFWGSAGGRPTGWGLYAAANGQVRAILDADNGIVWGSGSVRSPLFYDSDNTGYYVDPASTTQLHYVLANNWFRAQGNTGIYFQDWGGGLWMTDATWIRTYNGKNFYCDATIQAGTNMYSPIYYDLNDGSYYCDPNGTSRFNRILANCNICIYYCDNNCNVPSNKRCVSMASNFTGNVSSRLDFSGDVDGNDDFWIGFECP